VLSIIAYAVRAKVEIVLGRFVYYNNIVSVYVYASTLKISEEESDVFLNILSNHIVDTCAGTSVVIYIYVMYIIIISSISTYIRVTIYIYSICV